MSVNVTFYYTDKAHNSTYQPSSNGRTLQCQLKFPCSIVSPVIRVNRSSLMDGDPSATPPIPAPQHRWNYAYITDFERYYFAGDIVEDGPFMEYHFVVDPLASHKTEIGASSQYVLRASAAKDGQIVDSIYPTKAWTTHDKELIASTVWSTTYTGGGVWSIGIAGNGTTHYYLMDPYTAESFFAYLLSTTSGNNYTAAVLTDLGIDTYPQLKLMVDPLQYITSLVWIPFIVPTTGMTAISGIRIGYTMVNLSPGYAYRIDDPLYTMTVSATPTIAHPEAATRGQYLNAGPFTEVDLYVPGFGLMQLDPVLIASNLNMRIDIRIDLRTGSATMELFTVNPGTPPDEAMISRVAAQIGMPAQLSQVIMPGTSLVQVAGSTIGALASAFTGNVLGAISSAINSVGDAISGTIPRATTIGNSGGADGLCGGIYLIKTYHSVVDADNGHLGSPLCQTRQISAIGGYIKCSPQMHLQVSCTDSEYSQIVNYMTSGFYYE